jgi:tRNA A-37 threonylcarbamoyl transferase component Bud32
MTRETSHSTQEEFVRARHGNLEWHVRRSRLNDRLVGALENPDEWLRTRARLFKGFERSSTVGAADGIVIKRANFRKALNLLKDLFRASRSARAFQYARRLDAIGVATPRAVAMSEKRCCRFLLTSYFVTEEIVNARHLGEYLASVSRPDDMLIRRLADLIARLHNGGFSHRDLKESNILLDENLRPYLIDLDGLGFFRKVLDSRAASNLERFLRGMAKYNSVTRRERLIFLLCYCRVRGLKRVPGN